MEKQALINFVNDGYSQRQIANELQCSQGSIKYWLKKFELKTKNNIFNTRTDEYKICPICETKKSLDEFYKRSNRADISGYCKKCSNQYHTERVKYVKLKMIDYKGGECKHCKLKIKDSHYCVFEFHHLNPKIKDSNFEKIKYQKWDVIIKELDKCIMLCSNCHRMEHAKIEGW